MPSATLALLRLTSRDRLLVETLAELRFMTVHQIRQACYPTLRTGSVSHRLSRLRGGGVLERAGGRAFDDRRVFWGLGTAGRLAAGALAGTVPPGPRSLAVGALLMDHLIATNQIFCDLCTECRAGRLAAFSWVGSHHARLDLGLTHLVPDAIIVVPAPEGGRWIYCLERDRGTMPAQRLEEKWRRYRLLDRLALERAGDPRWDALADAWVIIACDDDRRAKASACTAARAGLERVWAGSATTCAAALAAAVGSEALAPERLTGDAAGLLPLPGTVGGVSYRMDAGAAPGAAAGGAGGPLPGAEEVPA